MKATRKRVMLLYESWSKVMVVLGVKGQVLVLLDDSVRKDGIG